MPPIGSYNTNWVAIASCLFNTVVKGRLLFEVIDNAFFVPLAYVSDLVASADPINAGMSLDTSISTGGLIGVSSRLKSDDDDGRDIKTIIRGTSDVFTRLLLVAHILSSRLQQFIKNDRSECVGITSIDNGRKKCPTSKDYCDLTDKEYEIINSFARRQEEVMLENICGQAIALCIGVLSLIEEGILGDREISYEENGEKSSDYFVRRYVERIPFPPGSNCWSPLLLILLNELSIFKLPLAVKCMAEVGIDGVVCCYRSLSAEILEEKKLKLKKVQDDLILEVQIGTYDSLITTQLQNISSILNDHLDYFLNESENKYLIDIPTISTYLRNHTNPIVRDIFTQLKVKHYGACLQYLRQTLGLLSYHNLRSKIRLNIDNKNGNEIRILNEKSEGTESSIINAEESQSNVYQERVPEDWENLQNKSVENPENIKSACELLSDLINEYEMVKEENTYDHEDDVDQICQVYIDNYDKIHNSGTSDDGMDISSPQVDARNIESCLSNRNPVVMKGDGEEIDETGDEDVPLASGILL